MVSLINKQLLLTAYAYLFIMEQQKAQQGNESLQLQSQEKQLKADGIGGKAIDKGGKGSKEFVVDGDPVYEAQGSESFIIMGEKPAQGSGKLEGLKGAIAVGTVVEGRDSRGVVTKPRQNVGKVIQSVLTKGFCRLLPGGKQAPSQVDEATLRALALNDRTDLGSGKLEDGIDYFIRVEIGKHVTDDMQIMQKQYGEYQLAWPEDEGFLARLLSYYATHPKQIRDALHTQILAKFVAHEKSHLEKLEIFGKTIRIYPLQLGTTAECVRKLRTDGFSFPSAPNDIFVLIMADMEKISDMSHPLCVPLKRDVLQELRKKSAEWDQPNPSAAECVRKYITPFLERIANRFSKE